MGKHGENPAAPKGTTNPKQCEIHSFLESHYSKRTPSSMSAFPNKIASSGKSSLHSCPRRNDFQALASRFPIWGSFFVQSQLQRSFWVCDAWFFFPFAVVLSRSRQRLHPVTSLRRSQHTVHRSKQGPSNLHQLPFQAPCKLEHQPL